MNEDLFQAMDEWGPEKVVCVSDRRSGMRGLLVIDNTARGLGKGGTRMTPTLTVAEVARLARAMTWKWAAVDLAYGGAKAGILGNPNGPNKEKVLRSFARSLANEVPSEYVLGLDVGLSERDAAIFIDELQDRGVAVGLPAALGGFPYDELGTTGIGVAEATLAALESQNKKIAGQRVAVQGFGAVGTAAARHLAEHGAIVTTVSTSRGVIQSDGGFDVDALIALRRERGDELVHYVGGEVGAIGTDLLADVDILIPAATQDVIDEDNVTLVRASLIVEGANLAISEKAREALHASGVTVVPDFIANAGGVVAAAFSMDARYSGFAPDPTDVTALVASKIRSNTAAVLERAQRAGVHPRTAALSLSQDRVREAMTLRGTPTTIKWDAP